MHKEGEDIPRSTVRRVTAALLCLFVGAGLLGVAAVDPLEFRGNFLTVLFTLGGVGLALVGIGLLTPRVVGMLLELILEIMAL